MASIQYERKEEVAVQFSNEEKASLDEIVKHAENYYESEDIENQCLAVVAEKECLDKAAAVNLRITAIAGALRNQTKGPLSLVNSKKWAGHIVKNYPNPLKSTGAFVQSAMSDKGVKAGVLYAGNNRAGVECGWLLAWADTKALGKRIYAECGPKSKFNNIDWAKVEAKLNVAGSSLAKASDKETGTSVYATLVGSGAKDALGAAFLG